MNQFLKTIARIPAGLAFAADLFAIAMIVWLLMPPWIRMMGQSDIAFVVGLLIVAWAVIRIVSCWGTKAATANGSKA